MTELRAVLAAVLLFEAAYRAGLLSRRPTGLADLAWVLGLGAATAAGWLAFGGNAAFAGSFCALVFLTVFGYRTGLLDDRSGFLSRWRFVPAVVVGALTGSAGWTALAGLVAVLDRRAIRWGIIHLTGRGGALGVSTEDLDILLPPPITVEPRRRERGMILLEAIVGLTLISAVSMAAFTAVANRAARIRQMRESTVAREHAVSELERLRAVPFDELAARDGAEFAVPGRERGRVEVETLETGLARIRITAPRRGATPVVLETIRSRRSP